MGYGVHQLHDDGVDDVHHQHAGDSPDDGKLQTNVALDVERVVGVIPPLVVENAFHGKTGNELKQGGKHHAAEEKQQQIILHRLQHQHHAENAEAVDRADRAVEKAPVHKFSGLQRGEGHLTAPAQAGVDQHNPPHLNPCISHYLSPVLPLCALF